MKRRERCPLRFLGPIWPDVGPDYRENAYRYEGCGLIRKSQPPHAPDAAEDQAEMEAILNKILDHVKRDRPRGGSRGAGRGPIKV